MQFNYYIIAVTEGYGKKSKPLTIEKCSFTKEEDFEDVIEFLEDQDTNRNIDDIDQDNITDKEFDTACRNNLIQEVLADYEQRLIPAMLLTEKQFKLIQAFKD